MLAELPDPNKLVAPSTAIATSMVTMAENVARANPSPARGTRRLLVERVQATGRTVEPGSIEWTTPTRPFFEHAALLVRPRTAARAHQVLKSLSTVTHRP